MQSLPARFTPSKRRSLSRTGAAAAFPAWSQTGTNRRRELLLRTARTDSHSRAATFVDLMVARPGCRLRKWGNYTIVHASITEAIREAASLTREQVTLLETAITLSKPAGCLAAYGARIPAGVLLLGSAALDAPLVLGLRAILIPCACATRNPRRPRR